MAEKKQKGEYVPSAAMALTMRMAALEGELVSLTSFLQTSQTLLSALGRRMRIPAEDLARMIVQHGENKKYERELVEALSKLSKEKAHNVKELSEKV